MADPRKKFALPSRFASRTSVWVEYAQLSAEYKPFDLGHGFPNFPPPQHVKDALLEVGTDPGNVVHQYTRGGGHPRLVKALSKLYSKVIGREINPMTEIQTTQGGYHALFCSFAGLIDEGDEVILMEPAFDAYEPNIRACGGVPKFIPLRLRDNLNGKATAADFILDRQELENTFNDKTKLIIVNTPHNPLGKVFSYEELEHITNLCKKWNVVCIADEVYEWLVYDNKTHVRMATLPDMWERTLTIGSAGKIFGVTGWKLGWVYGPDHLIDNIRLIHQDCVRVGNTIIQEAVAICFEKELTRFGQPDCYLVSLGKQLELKRNFMYKFLGEAGLKPFLSEGGYFMVADWSSLEKYIDLSGEKDVYRDYRFTKWMTKNVGVQGIPNSTFYTEKDKHLGENFVRYCFVKTDDYLKQTALVLSKWRPQLNHKK